MADGYKNFAAGTVKLAPSPATTGLTLTLKPGEGLLMPAVPFNAVAKPKNVQPLLTNAEIVRVTDIDGDVLTIERHAEDTTAKPISANWDFYAGVTAKTLDDMLELIALLEAGKADAADLQAHEADTTNPHDVTKAQIGLSNVQNTSDLAKPISTATQAALDTKANDAAVEKTANKDQPGGYAGLDSGGKVPAGQLPAFVDDVLEFANLGAFPGSGSTGVIYLALDTSRVYRWSGSTYAEISPSPGSTDAVPEGGTNKYYTDARAQAAAPVQSVAGRQGDVIVAKADVGLSNVDNTSDASKPVSTPQAAADAAVAATAQSNLVSHTSNTSNPHNVTKAQVGLGNADNTSDAAKPVSTAQQAALDVKAPLASPGLTGTPTAPTAAPSTNTVQIATTAFVQTLIANLIASAPGALDTLDELAAAFGDDPNFAATMTTALAGKQPLDQELTALAAVTSAANKLAYFTGAGSAGVTDLSAFGRMLIDDADAATARKTLSSLEAEASAVVTKNDATGVMTARLADGTTMTHSTDALALFNEVLAAIPEPAVVKFVPSSTPYLIGAATGTGSVTKDTVVLAYGVKFLSDTPHTSGEVLKVTVDDKSLLVFGLDLDLNRQWGNGIGGGSSNLYAPRLVYAKDVKIRRYYSYGIRTTNLLQTHPSATYIENFYCDAGGVNAQNECIMTDAADQVIVKNAELLSNKPTYISARRIYTDGIVPKTTGYTGTRDVHLQGAVVDARNTDLTEALMLIRSYANVEYNAPYYGAKTICIDGLVSNNVSVGAVRIETYNDGSGASQYVNPGTPDLDGSIDLLDIRNVNIARGAIELTTYQNSYSVLHGRIRSANIENVRVSTLTSDNAPIKVVNNDIDIMTVRNVVGPSNFASNAAAVVVRLECTLSDIAISELAIGRVQPMPQNLVRVFDNSAGRTASFNLSEVPTSGLNSHITSGTPTVNKTVSLAASLGPTPASARTAIGVDLAISQVAHGFALGDIVYDNGTQWAKATAANSSLGIVIGVTDANNFTLATNGPVSVVGAGWTKGAIYYAHQSAAGALTATEPTIAGQVWRPLLVATSPTTGIFKPPIGITLSSGGTGILDGKSALSYRATGSTLNKWYTSPISSVALTTTTPAINTLFAIPLVIERTTTLDQVAINVTTAGAASHIRVGVYADNGNLYPDGLLVDAGVIDTSTTGVKTVTFAAPLVLAPGLYWLASVGDGTPPVVRAIATTGFIPILGMTSALATSPHSFWQVAFTYAALPATFTSGGASQAAPANAIFVRASA